MPSNDNKFFDAIAYLIEWTQIHNIPLEGLRIVLETPTVNDKYKMVRSVEYSSFNQPVPLYRDVTGSGAVFQFMGVSVEVRAASDYEGLKEKLRYYEELIERIRRNNIHVGAHTYDLATITYPSSGKR